VAKKKRKPTKWQILKEVLEIIALIIGILASIKTLVD